MTPRQLIALTHPCARAEDTFDERFMRQVSYRGFLISTILSVNK